MTLSANNHQIINFAILHFGPNFADAVEFAFDRHPIDQRVLNRLFNNPMSVSATVFDIDRVVILEQIGMVPSWKYEAVLLGNLRIFFDFGNKPHSVLN